MNAVKTAAEALLAALGTVPGLRVHRDLGARVDPPAALLGAPALACESYCSGYTAARFLVYVVVAADDRAVERLWDLVPLVKDAIEDQVPDATAGEGYSTQPGSWPVGATDLPAYTIQVDVPLGGS